VTVSNKARAADRRRSDTASPRERRGIRVAPVSASPTHRTVRHAFVPVRMLQGLLKYRHRCYTARYARLRLNTGETPVPAAEMVTGNPNARPDLIPVGRFGSGEETAEVAVMLARNGYITGQTINVNGGWYMS